MVQASDSSVKKIKTRRVSSSALEEGVATFSVNTSKKPNPLSQIFSDLLGKIHEAKTDFEKLQKDILETKEA